MKDKPTPAEAVDLLEKVAIESAAARKRAGVATGIYWQSNERRAYERAFTEEAVLALLSRLRAADQRAAELAKENNHMRASLATYGGPCIYCNLPKEEWGKCAAGFPGCARADDANLCPEFGAMMELHEAGQRAAELAAQNAVLRAAVDYYADRDHYVHSPLPAGGFSGPPVMIDYGAIARTARATTPAEALAVVREMQEAIADMVRGIQLGAEEAGLDPNRDQAVVQGNRAIAAARRIFGSRKIVK